MLDDPVLKMYEAQAELLETRQELEKIRRENDELKNERAANHLTRIIVDFQNEYSSSFKTIEENLRTLTTTVSHNHDTFSEIKETLKQQNKDIQILKKTMKTTGKKTILLLGGRNWSKVVDSLLILQSNGENDGSWKELNLKLPYPICLHGAQFLNNYLHIFGGQNEKDEVLSSSYKLTRGHKWLTNSLQWEKITDMNGKRTNISNSSVILNGRIWVMGGWNKKTLKSVEAYDPKTNTKMHQCRALAAAAVVDGKIFCCGGGVGGNFLKSAECYDPFSDVWTLIYDMPGPNGACGIVVMDGYLIIVGGKASIDKDYLNSVWLLDTTDRNGKWMEKEPSLSRARSQFNIAKIDGQIFVCGGIYINKEDYECRITKDVEIFDGEAWKDGPKLTTCEYASAAVTIPVEFGRYLK